MLALHARLGVDQQSIERLLLIQGREVMRSYPNAWSEHIYLCRCAVLVYVLRLKSMELLPLGRMPECATSIGHMPRTI